MINKNIIQASKGCSLSEAEEKELAEYLGLRISKKKAGILIGMTVVFIPLLAFFLGLFSLYDGSTIITVILILLYIGAFLFYTVGSFKKRCIDYLKAIDEYYNEVLRIHEGSEVVFTWFIPNPESYLTKKSILFITDSYYFYLREDMLKQTNYFLNRRFITKYCKFPVLKVFDPDSLSKREYSFKLSEINSYHLVGEVIESAEHERIEEFTHVFEKQLFESYIEIELKNYQTIKVGTNVYSILKKIIPLKEV